MARHVKTFDMLLLPFERIIELWYMELKEA